jgi:hypothetical protein
VRALAGKVGLVGAQGGKVGPVGWPRRRREEQRGQGSVRSTSQTGNVLVGCKRSREGLQALGDTRDALDAFIAMREPMRKANAAL